MAEPSDIHAFWFGKEPYESRDVWFRGGQEFDDACRRFQPDWEMANTGALDHWLETPESLLAFVILTDQIPRNIFREDARSFATDARALSAAQHAVAKGWDKAMHEFEAVFLYLPYEHAEDINVQNESVRLFTELDGGDWMDFVIKHQQIIAQFGRFPHRNAALGRQSTPEELAFMEDHGRGF